MFNYNFINKTDIERKKKYLLQPFDEIICKFFYELSDNIFEDKLAKNYPDVITYAFWIRKRNIIELKNKFKSSIIRKPLGTIFHLTPNNVPVNFAYSLFFGLITGNSNIIKLPSKDFVQNNLIINLILKILKKKNYKKLKELVNFIKYEKNNINITKTISANSNARLIWGGDKTVDQLRKIYINPKTKDITFPDRYSFSIINLSELRKLNKKDMSELIKKFYFDTYTFDQNACNSPHLILWYNINKKNSDTEFFWKQLNIFISNKIDYPDTVVSEKYNILCRNIIDFNNITKHKAYSKFLNVVSLNKLLPNNHEQRGRWGFFYEFKINNLNAIEKIINEKYQTLTYYGFDRDFFEKFAKKNSFNGIDRIVPIGRSLEMNYIWDGINFFDTLTRIIDIK